MDLQAYLASSSDEEKEGVEDLKALVAGSDSESAGEESEMDGHENRKTSNEGDMEATFSVKASELEGKLAERAKQAGLDGRAVHTLQQETQSAWEKYLEKRKLKRRERKQKAKEDREKIKRMKNEQNTEGSENAEDLDLLMDDQKDRGFNFRGPQRKAHDQGPSQDDHDHFKMNVNDSRISKVFNSADFEIDPTNPEFRKSEGMLEVLKEKRKRKRQKGKVPKAPAVATAEPKEETVSSKSSLGLQIFASQKRLRGTGSGKTETVSADAVQAFQSKRKKKVAK